MTEIITVLNPTHFQRTGALYELTDTYADGAVLGGTARQLAHGNEYPIERHTPGGAALTDANFAQSIRNAVAAAQLVCGGTVIVPRGTWRPADLAEEEIVILGVGRDKNVVIAGGGMDETNIVLPTGYSGTAFFFKGSPSVPAAADLFWNGGMRDLTIQCESSDASNDGIGIRCEGCINTQFRNVTIRNFVGGTGFKCTTYPPDYTNQYLQLWNFTVASCRVNYDLTSFVNCQGYGVYSSAAQYRDYLVDESKFSFYGGNFQSSAPICMESTGNGGNQIALYDFYYEGFAPAIFKVAAPSGHSSRFELHGFHLGGSPTTFLDVDAFNTVVVSNIALVGNATVILKARNGPDIVLINCGDPVANAAKYDLDTASRARLTCISNGVTYCGGGLATHGDLTADGDFTVSGTIDAGGDITTTGALDVAGAITADGDVASGGKVACDDGYDLPGFATDSEPVGAAAGRVVRDTSLDRPTFKTSGGTWKRYALSQDDNDLTALLTPYCTDIFDPGIYRLRSIVSSAVDSLTGFLNGSVISAPTAGQRPAWTLSDDFFGGRPSFQCARVGDYFLQGTLGATIPIGSYPGLFAVYRCNPGVDDPVYRRLAALAEHGADHSSGVIVGQSDLNESNHGYGVASGASATAFAVGGVAGTDAYGHVAQFQSVPGGVIYDRDTDSPVTGVPAGATTSVIDTFTIGGCWTSAVYAGCDIQIAYLALLKTPLDPDTRVKALRAAMSRYSLR